MGDAAVPAKDPSDPTSYVWTLVDGEQRAREHPDTFEVPPRDQREQLGLGDFAKAIFVTPSMLQQNMGERMWLRVLERKQVGKGPITYRGQLDNSPHLVSGLKAGDDVTFRPENVIAIESTKRRPGNGGGGGGLVVLALAALAFGKKKRNGRGRRR